MARGTDPDDVFVQLEKAIVAVRGGDTDGMNQASDALKRAFDRASAALSRTGAAMNAISAQQTRLASLQQGAEARIDGYEATNMAEAISRMSQADTVYRAALGAVGTTGQMSLMDYLR